MPAKTGAHHGMKYGYSTGEDGYGADLSATIQRNDNLLTRAVKSRGLNTPPGSPSHGHRYIVGTSPTGAWNSGGSKANQIAAYDGDAAVWVFYVPEKGWDVFVDDEGRRAHYNGTNWRGEAVVDGAMFATVQAAVDAAAAAGGGVVLLPEGTFNSSSTPSFTGVTLPGKVQLKGVGIDHAAGTGCTVLDLAGQSTSITGITINGSDNRVSDLILKGQNSSGSGYGIKFNPTGIQRNNWVENCYIYFTPSWCVEFAGGPSNDFNIMCGVRGGRIREPLSNGAIHVGPYSYGTTLHKINSDSAVFNSQAVYVVEGATDTYISECAIESQSDAPMVRVSYASGYKSAWNTVIEKCLIEAVNATASSYMIEVTGAGQTVGLTISRNKFVRAVSDKAPKMFKSLPSSGTLLNCVIENNQIFDIRPTLATPTDDIYLASTGDHDLVTLRSNLVWNQSNASFRHLAVKTGGGELLNRLMRSHDLTRLRVPLYATGSLPADALDGELAFDTSTNKLKVYGAGAWTAVH